MKKLRLNLIMLILIASMFLISCGSNLKGKAIEQGKLVLDNKEHDKALSSFEVAVDEGSNEKEILNIIKIIDNYIKAKDAFEKDELDSLEA